MKINCIICGAEAELTDPQIIAFIQEMEAEGLNTAFVCDEHDEEEKETLSPQKKEQLH